MLVLSKRLAYILVYYHVQLQGTRRSPKKTKKNFFKFFKNSVVITLSPTTYIICLSERNAYSMQPSLLITCFSLPAGILTIRLIPGEEGSNLVTTHMFLVGGLYSCSFTPLVVGGMKDRLDIGCSDLT